jgi:alpha-glucosidase
MMLLRIIFIFTSLLVTCAFTQEWYEGANFYQIYPRSFKDSDGDGVGDLQGIKSKLQYLKDLGMDGVWLSPIMKSPQADFGYDISDFRDIHYEYGTLQDFDELAAECKRLGIKLIMDFVPNHTSDEHEWFKKSENSEPGYEDFYIWRDPKHDNVSNIAIPPNNWKSIFAGEAWRWSEKREKMYFHTFHKKQPDLNYRNPKVVEEMKSILKFWMERGVSGFRIDAITHVFEKMNPDGSFPDEPRSYDQKCAPTAYCFLNHVNTTWNQPETYELVQQWRKMIDDFTKTYKSDSKVLMVEATGSIEAIQKYYANGQVKGAHIPFNFQLMGRLKFESNAEDYKTIVEDWLSKVPSGEFANWLVSLK